MPASRSVEYTTLIRMVTNSMNPDQSDLDPHCLQLRLHKFIHQLVRHVVQNARLLHIFNAHQTNISMEANNMDHDQTASQEKQSDLGPYCLQ